MTLLVQAHGGTLVHAHVCITQEAARLALDALWVQRVQLLWTHFQVGFHLRTWRYLGYVKTILSSVSICHAVKEEPCRICISIFDKGHIVTGFNTKHSKELHPLSGEAALSSHALL